jgi:hypothetical protein
MRPILVTGPGRSGTTLLMSLLAASPGIVAADLPPYETRQLAYYGNAHHVLTQPADTVRSTHQDRVHGDFYHIGFNPYNGPAHDQAFRTQALVQDFSAHYVPAQLDSAFAGLVREYYGRMARDHGKPGAALFAEKNNNLQRVVWQFVRRAFPGAREIVTVRDPRDVFCSYIAYFKVDGDYAFSDLCHEGDRGVTRRTARRCLLLSLRTPAARRRRLPGRPVRLPGHADRDPARPGQRRPVRAPRDERHAARLLGTLAHGYARRMARPLQRGLASLPGNVRIRADIDPVCHNAAAVFSLPLRRFLGSSTQRRACPRKVRSALVGLGWGYTSILPSFASWRRHKPHDSYQPALSLTH